MILDIGCSTKKIEGAIGIDKLPVADICHDLEKYPWPVESEAFDLVNASHVMEHIKPWEFFGVMDECWRALKMGGTMEIRTPFGAAYAFDPTHCLLFQESSFYYLTPLVPTLYEIYKPKPWNIVSSERNMETLELKTVLQKVAA